MKTITITFDDQAPPCYDVRGEITVAEFVGALEIVKGDVLDQAREAAKAAATPARPAFALPNGRTLPKLRG